MRSWKGCDLDILVEKAIFRGSGRAKSVVLMEAGVERVKELDGKVKHLLEIYEMGGDYNE